MSYQNWANFAWMLPATIENANLLGIDYKKIVDKYRKPEEDESYEDLWDEAIREVAYNNEIVVENPFLVYATYVSGEDEMDDDMDSTTNIYFSFNFSELYTPTPLHERLSKLGMKLCTWVSGG